MILSGIADRASPPLFTTFLLALTVSISAAQIALGLLAVAWLLRLADPELRAASRFPLLAPLSIFAGVTLLSALFSPAPTRALVESKELLLIATFFLAVNCWGSQERTLSSLRWFFGAIALISLYGLLQFWTCRSDVPVSWAASLLRVKLEACRAAPLFRAKGFYSIYMTYAGVLMTAITLMLAIFALLPWRQFSRMSSAALLAIPALGVTFVRNAWLGLAAAFVILLALTQRVRLLGVVVLLGLLLLLFPSPILTRVKTIGDTRDPTTQDRLDFWKAGAQMVKDHPLLGVGPGHVRLFYPSYRHPEARRPSIGHLHSNVVHLAAERGLLGLGAWLWVWVAFLARATRIYFRLPRTAEKSRAVVAGGLAASVAFFIAGLFEYNFGDSEVQMLLWVVMALPFAVERWPAGHPDALPT